MLTNEEITYIIEGLNEYCHPEGNVRFGDAIVNKLESMRPTDGGILSYFLDSTGYTKFGNIRNDEKNAQLLEMWVRDFGEEEIRSLIDWVSTIETKTAGGAISKMRSALRNKQQSQDSAPDFATNEDGSIYG